MDTHPADDLLFERIAPQTCALRLAVVTETYPPEINGVARTLAQLVSGLQSRGHDIQLVRPRQPLEPGPTTAPAPGTLLTRGMPIPHYKALRLGLPAKKRLFSAWVQRRPDLVHIATEGPLGWSALQAARKLRIPVSSDFRTNFHAYSGHYGMGWLGRPIAAYLRKFHNLAGCTMVPTEALRAALQEQRFERLHVVARGVDTAHYSPTWRDEALRAHWGAQPGQLVALYVGRLAAEKNPGLLVRAFEAMRASRPDSVFVVVGDGPERAALVQQLPHAHFAGMQTGTALARHYASADAFVFPSLTETYGNVVPEAMASGLPVLAFDQAAAQDLIAHGVHGWLAAAGDEAAFLGHATALAHQGALCRPMGLQAQAAVAERGWPRIVDQVEALWSQLLREARPAANDPPLLPSTAARAL